MTGSLCVLNVGAGDIELKFNQHEPDELARAVKILTDMQQRGCAILVKNEDGSYSRAHAIDASRGLYVISGEPRPQAALPPPPERQALTGDVLDPAVDPDADADALVDQALRARRRGRPPKRTVPIATSHAVGVGRSAGG
jgi:hypothetical protein